RIARRHLGGDGNVLARPGARRSMAGSLDTRIFRHPPCILLSSQTLAERKRQGFDSGPWKRISNDDTLRPRGSSSSLSVDACDWPCIPHCSSPPRTIPTGTHPVRSLVSSDSTIPP